MKVSQAQSLLLQGFLTILGGAAVTSIAGTYQLAITRHLDWTTLLMWLANSFIIAVGLGLKSYVPAHIPQELQALKDAQQQTAAGQQQILNEFGNFTMARPAIRPPTQPQPIVLRQPTAPIPAFVPPARPATIQPVALPDVPQQPFPVAPDVQPPTPDAGG